MEQPPTNIFGIILSAIERRLSTYFGDDKILPMDGKDICKHSNYDNIIYSEGILPSYSSDSFDKCKDFDMDSTNFNQTINQTKPIRKSAKIIPINECEKTDQTICKIIEEPSLGKTNEYCDMV